MVMLLGSIIYVDLDQNIPSWYICTTNGPRNMYPRLTATRIGALIMHTFTSIVLTMDRFTFSLTDHLYSGVLGI